jgi:DNA-binding response OmpR family regulator
MMQILIVEDNARILSNLEQALAECGHDPLPAASGRAARALARSHPGIDLVILDLGLPDVDGLDLLPELQLKIPEAAVLILTARDSIDDRVTGLNSGADDYLVKPFSIAELIARVRALERRNNKRAPDLIQIEDLILNLRDRSVTRAGRELLVTPKEFDMLFYLCRNVGHPVSREGLAQAVLHISSSEVDFNNVIEVHISNLRKKIDADFPLKLIHTVRGVGYSIGVR